VEDVNLLKVSASNVFFPSVYSIYLTMLVCLFLDAVDMHFWFGAGFGDLDKFAKARYSGVTSPIIGSLVGLCVQFFFAYRISMFRQAVLFSGFVALVGPLASSKCIVEASKALRTSIDFLDAGCGWDRRGHNTVHRGQREY
jgi:predicted membrane channel-forming protein YqfA (hemolysin III family)